MAFDGALKVEVPAIEGTRGENNGGVNAREAFLVSFGGHLPQTSARSKQHVPVIFDRLAFIRQSRIFMKVGVENYWRFNGINPLR